MRGGFGSAALAVMLGWPGAVLAQSGALVYAPGAPTAGFHAATAPSGGGYGGGFIEALMTGATPASPPRRSAPVAYETYEPGPYGPGRAPHADPGDPWADPSLGRPRPMAPSLALAAVQRRLDPRYERQAVAYGGPHRPGTIVIDTPSKFLYLVQPGGQALRYGIGVGRPGFTWAGLKTVSMKKEWPAWTPPPEMLRRRPDLPRHMEGGPENPLGAPAPSISDRRSTGSTARTSLTRSASPSRPAASG